MPRLRQQRRFCVWAASLACGRLPCRIVTLKCDQWLACMIQALDDLAVDPTPPRSEPSAFRNRLS